MLPCLNESETLGVCIDKARKSLDDHNITGEIIVADNGSTDGSQEIARKHGARIIDIQEKGYGSALIGGFGAALGTYVLMADADDSYDLANTHTFVEKMRNGHDMVMGNRFKGGIAPGAMPFLHRYVGNPVLSSIGRIFFGSPVGDFHCGMRAFRRETIAKLDLRTTGMEFASESVVKATLHGLDIAEVPTTLSPDGRTRAPHLNTWRDGWRHLRFLLLYSPRWLFVYPGAFMMLLGLITGALLFAAAPLRVGPFSFSIHTFLYSSLAVLIGFQSVWFGVLTKIFAINEGLLPPDQRFENITRFISLEMGIIVGGLLILSGLAGSIHAVSIWEGVAFGGLDPKKVFPIVIPSVTAIALGFQLILSTFFASILGLKRL